VADGILDFGPPAADGRARGTAVNIANTAQRELRPPWKSREDESRWLTGGSTGALACATLHPPRPPPL
jgi:hypothetical protein